MRIETFSYRFAREILEHPSHVDAYDEVMEVCSTCPLPVFKGKSSNQASRDVVQQVMNTYLRIAFCEKGWEDEPPASPPEYGDELRADFRKTFYTGAEPLTVQIEAEFGNAASIYRNLFKFSLSFASNLCDVGVIIVPSQHLCTRIDSGVANFEKVCRELPSAKLSTTVPIFVIGLFDEEGDGSSVEEWDVKSLVGDLDVAKGMTNATAGPHNAFIKEYRDSIREYGVTKL